MPTYGYCYNSRPPRCHRAYKWSTFRGGCRFDRGHKGECKPGRRV